MSIVSKLLARLRKKPVPALSAEERSAIRSYAQGDEGSRAEALRSFYAARLRGVSDSAEPAMRFMSEVDTSVPDLNLRAAARKALLAS